MALTIKTAATNKKMIAVATVKEDLGISGSDFDVLLGRLVDEASDTICSISHLPFYQERWLETFAGHGRQIAMLTRTPLVTLHAITYQGTALDATTYSIENALAGFIFKADGWNSTELFGHDVSSHAIPGAAYLDYEADYTAGYRMPGDEGTAGDLLPATVQRIALDFVKGLWLLRKARPGVVSEHIADWGANYEDLYVTIERRLMKAGFMRVA